MSCKNCQCAICDHREPNQIETLFVASSESKESGAVVVESPAAPDLLNQLHTLRSLANQVKAQADFMRQFSIAAHCASVSESASLAIDHYNATHCDHGQKNAGSTR